MKNIAKSGVKFIAVSFKFWNLQKIDYMPQKIKLQ